MTTTPKPTALLRDLVRRAAETDGVLVRRGTTFDNAANLAPAALDELRRRYEGTRLGRQELYAELLLDTPGALWTIDALDAGRVAEAPALRRIVVGVDPAVTAGEDADETGIVVAGLGEDGHGYVLDDRTLRASPDAWARAVIETYDHHQGDRVVAEVNQGGDLVESVLRMVDPSVPLRKVHAAKGKRLRAEPVAALYEQGRVHHVGAFPTLEDQMCTWTPETKESPDRVDALVWALTELMVEAPRRRRIVVPEAA